ncbi:MAG TPA: hypothetical protein VEG38_06620 [Acidimicrobiia bacterium]|nr:hypothetical protein [Acidimicrobiia bacterium]
MLGGREQVAAISAAVTAAAMAGLAVFAAGLDTGEVVEVRVQGRPASAADPSAHRAPEPALGDAEPVVGPAAGRQSAAGRVVWADDADVWLFDAGTGERRRLTTDGVEQREYSPQFRDAERVTYLVPTEPYAPGATLMEIDLASGERRLLRRLAVGTAYGWSPDGEMFATYGATGNDEARELHIIGNGPPRVRRFKPILGRGGFVNYDETRVEWSPDGRHLMLLDTALDTRQAETLFVLTADGRDATVPRPGTWARWSADGRTIYCLCGQSSAADECTWQALDVTEGTATSLPIPAGARPSLSPDGRFLAFDDGEDTPSVHVLELGNTAGRPRLLARSALAPIWLSASQLAVTDTRPCRRSEDDCIAGGHGSMFESAGTASAVDLASGRRTPLPPIATEGADTAPAD